jgi:hypothetical protein
VAKNLRGLNFVHIDSGRRCDSLPVTRCSLVMRPAKRVEADVTCENCIWFAERDAAAAAPHDTPRASVA